MKTTATNLTAKTYARAAIAAAIAGALSLGAVAPALAQEAGAAAPDAAAASQDASSDEQGWDASADESTFGSDADALVENGGAIDGSDSADDLSGAYGPNWWYRRVSPQQATWAAEDYFGVYDYDSSDYEIGRFRGIPAYRVVIDDYGYAPYRWRTPGYPYGTRYVAFVNYFTGRVIDGYETYL